VKARFIIFCALWLAAACGGGAVQPRPLQYHLKPEYLVSVDPMKQQDALTAKSEYDMAMLQRNKIKSDLEQIDLELLKASNDAKAADLAIDSARAEDKAAAATADTARKQRATEALRTATLRREAAGARRDYVQARKLEQEKLLRWAEFNVYGAESKFELAKAAVAVNNSIAPAGFEYGSYEAQHTQRVAETAQAKLEADRAQTQLDGARRALEEKESELAGTQQ
jgi:hypothetical protein